MYKNLTELISDMSMALGSLDVVDSGVVEVMKYECTKKYAEELKEIRNRIQDIDHSIRNDFIYEIGKMKDSKIGFLDGEQ